MPAVRTLTLADVAWPRAKLSNDTEGGDNPEVHVLVTLMF